MIQMTTIVGVKSLPMRAPVTNPHMRAPVNPLTRAPVTTAVRTAVKSGVIKVTIVAAQMIGANTPAMSVMIAVNGVTKMTVKIGVIKMTVSAKKTGVTMIVHAVMTRVMNASPKKVIAVRKVMNLLVKNQARKILNKFWMAAAKMPAAISSPANSRIFSKLSMSGWSPTSNLDQLRRRTRSDISMLSKRSNAKTMAARNAARRSVNQRRKRPRSSGEVTKSLPENHVNDELIRI